MLIIDYISSIYFTQNEIDVAKKLYGHVSNIHEI